LSLSLGRPLVLVPDRVLLCGDGIANKRGFVTRYVYVQVEGVQIEYDLRNDAESRKDA